MDIKVLEEKDNILFNRKDLKLEIKHHGMPTPKKEEIVKEVALKHSVPEDHILIEYIFNKKGIGESIARVKIYKEKVIVKAKKVKEKPKEQPKEEKHEAQASEAK